MIAPEQAKPAARDTSPVPVRSSMTLAIAVWLCTLPFVFVLMIPLRGTGTAVTTALALLAAIALTCFVICWWTGASPGGDAGDDPWTRR